MPCCATRGFSTDPATATSTRRSGQRLSAARAAKKELDTKAAARVVLEATIDVLRAVPPSQEKEQELRERLESRTRRARDLTTAQRALEEALRNPAALGWTDAQGGAR